LVTQNNHERSGPRVWKCQCAGQNVLQALAALLQHDAEWPRAPSNSISKIKERLLEPTDADVQSLAAAALALDAVQLPTCKQVAQVTRHWRQGSIQNSGARRLLRPQTLDVAAASPQIYGDEV
jgi:hypothetical protein